MEKVILTLTTIPSRLKNTSPYGFKSVIYSLMNQSHEDYELHINIPEVNKKTGEEYIIPDWLNELNNVWVRRHVLRIYRTKDYGPVTKLYPTVQRIKDPNMKIIVVDDDLLYDSRMVEEHLKLRKKNNEVAWGFAGINALEKHQFSGIDRFVGAVNEDKRVGILEHYKSVSYVRGMFDDDFNDEFVTKGWADDELISAYMGMKGIKKYVGATNYIPKWETEEEWRKYGVVESFPVINRCSGVGGHDGCDLFRVDKEEILLDPSLSKYLAK